jgi:hypothetical protein
MNDTGEPSEERERDDALNLSGMNDTGEPSDEEIEHWHRERDDALDLIDLASACAVPGVIPTYENRICAVCYRTVADGTDTFFHSECGDLGLFVHKVCEKVLDRRLDLIVDRDYRAGRQRSPAERRVLLVDPWNRGKR